MIILTVVSSLLIGCHIVTSQSTDQDENRWVWRSLRSPSTSLELPLNPFEPFASAEEIHHESSNENLTSQTIISRRANQETAIHKRGNPEGARLSSFSPEQTTTPIPNVDSRVRSRGSSFVRDSRRVEQQNLGIAHFTIPRQLGRPVTVTTPTSNHLHSENEPLVSSYSSLDAEVTGLNELKNRNSGRNLISSPVKKSLGSIAIKPLPIDISQLPLESTERAEGIKKLWSSLTSQTEFAQIFEALAGRRRNNTTERSPSADTESSSILLDPHNSISESVIRVINPPQIQLQQQILKQQLRQQELQRQLQEQFEAEIQQEELKKRLEIQNLIREREEQQLVSVQQELAQEQQREALQQPQTGNNSRKQAEDENISDELQDLADPEDALRRRHEQLVERLQRRKETQSEQRRREEILEKRRRLQLLREQQLLQQQRVRLATDVLATRPSTVLQLQTSTEPSENDVSEEIHQRPTVVFPPPLPVPSRSLSPPNLDPGDTNSPGLPNSPAPSIALAVDAQEEGIPNENDFTIRSVRTAISGTSGTESPGTHTRVPGGVGQPDGTGAEGTQAPAGAHAGGTQDSNLLQTTVQLPTRDGDFVVRKIRLPGNHIMNVVFVPDEKNSPILNGLRPDISQSPSALRLFQSPDVQQSLLEYDNQNTVLVVEELIRNGKNLYLISTMEGDRVYPKEPSRESGQEEGNVWAAFVGVFNGESKPNVTASSFSIRHDSPTSIFSSDQNESTADSFAPVIRDPRNPLAKVSFSSGNIQNFPGRSKLSGQNLDSFQAPHAFLVRFSGQKNPSPFTPVANLGSLEQHKSVHQNKGVILPSSSVSTRFFNPFETEAQQSVGRRLRLEPARVREFQVSRAADEARGLESSHSRWPWPHEVPANLDSFFRSGPAHFRTTRT